MEHHQAHLAHCLMHQVHIDLILLLVLVHRSEPSVSAQAGQSLMSPLSCGMGRIRNGTIAWKAGGILTGLSHQMQDAAHDALA